MLNLAWCPFLVLVESAAQTQQNVTALSHWSDSLAPLVQVVDPAMLLNQMTCHRHNDLDPDYTSVSLY